MAAIHNYFIQFKSLRSGTLYTIDIGGGSGVAIELKGGAQPFVTQEDDSEDMFTPVRTQTGYIRIVDDGKDAAGVSLGADWWRDLIPSNDTERIVTLTHVENNSTVIDWQGFIQPQTFSGVLYGNPQEREFAIQCGLSSLESVPIDTSSAAPKNFAFIIYTFFYGYAAQYETFKFQGGADAREWLRKRVDLRNFLNADGTPRYNAFEVLQEICKYWGWTARTQGQTVIFTCIDDNVEQSWLTLSSSDLMSLGESTGTVSNAETAVALSGDIFVSTDNDETFILGPKNAVVKSDVNQADSIIKFAPEDLEAEMGEPTAWVADPDDASIGYFKTTPTKWSLGNGTPPSLNMGATALGSGNNGGFERRVIYSSAESENGANADVIKISTEPQSNTVLASIETHRVMTFSGGSLSITGQLYKGSQPFDADGVPIIARLGIGMSRQEAKWFYLTRGTDGGSSFTIDNGWDNHDTNRFHINTNGSQINGAVIYGLVFIHTTKLTFPKIPVAAALYGYLYLDIYGMNGESDFEIANLEITFTRESTTLPTSSSQPRSRTLPVELDTYHEFTSTTDDGSGETWNADLIFASDYDMEYGYGLLMNPNGSFMETAPYNTDTSYEYPEQHLANRVTGFWTTPRARLRMELNSVAGNVGSVSPTAKVSFASNTYYPISISRDWRDDIMILTLIDIPGQ